MSIEYNPHVKEPQPRPEATPEPAKEARPEPTTAPKPEPKPEVKVHPMRDVILDKLVVNIGVGDAGDKLIKAQRVLEMLTKQKPTQTLSKTTNKDLGIRLGMPIGCKVTLRGKTAEEFLKRALWIKENRIAAYSFDPYGNFSFGVSDYTDFEGMKYDPEIGIYGMDISCSLKRAGYRVANRKLKKGHIPKRHRITREEGIEFAKRKFNAEVIY